MNNDCIFCRVSAGTEHCHKIWEDEKHLAFLSIFPNTPGFSVVISKAHQPSYVCALGEDIYIDLLKAARNVAIILDKGFEDVARTGLIAEGYGVDHAHIKLFPMHGSPHNWRQVKSENRKFFLKYEGYISSHDGYRANDEELSEIANRIRAASISD